MNLEGKILGNRYEIIEKVGNGGMATVYKATDLVLKRYVAVKVLRDEFTTDEEFIKRFVDTIPFTEKEIKNMILDFESKRYLSPKSGGSGECIMKSNIATSPTHHSGLRFQILEGSKGVVGEILKS